MVADLDLCQGHQMCQGEAPDVFGFDEDADQVVVLQEHPDERPAPAGASPPSSTAQRWRWPSSRTIEEEQ